jgi:signal transduction histidine kinase
MVLKSLFIAGGWGKNPAAPYRVYFWLLVVGWTAAVAGWLAWNLGQEAQEARSLTAETARALLEKDLLYREWSILHGGVYLPKSSLADKAALAPDEEREVLTPSGRVLILLNPAVVSRQVFELQDQQMGISGHITSLTPLRSENRPDAWERRALEAFGQGAKEVSSVEIERGERYFRMMRPLFTKTGCRQCHEEQGRPVGQIRGGISVSVPLSRFTTGAQNARLIAGHAGLWLLGLGGLGAGARNLRRHVRARRRLEEALAGRRKELERLVAERTAKLNETIGELEQFSYAIIHDMRAPLRAMQGFAAMLGEEFGDCLPPKGLDYSRRIQEAANRMDRLITDSLQYSKVLREELPLTRVDVPALLRGIIESYPNLQPPGAEIHVEIGELKVQGNEAALTQCFSNLLGNAVKFVAPGVKPRVRVWAEEVKSAGCGVKSGEEGAKAENPGPEAALRGQVSGLAAHLSEFSAPDSRPSALPSVRIWVEDNGIGIPKGFQARIFDMFERGTNEQEGTGIGLAIVRKAAQRMGGKVGMDSVPGKGSRFWLELPRA